MRLAIIGSRTLRNFDKTAIAQHIPENVTDIISGGASGVDQLAREIAAERDVNFIEFLPDYNLFAKRAPLVRNEEIVRQADQVLAVWDFRSRGTAHVITRCIGQGVLVRVIGWNGVDANISRNALDAK